MYVNNIPFYAQCEQIDQIDWFTEQIDQVLGIE